MTVIVCGALMFVWGFATGLLFRDWQNDPWLAEQRRRQYYDSHRNMT